MTTELANRPQATLAAGDWQVMKEQAAMLVKTGFLPEAIKTPEQAVAIMLKGRELGIPSMYALSNIAVIKGKPTCNAELMLALVYRDHGDHALAIEHSDEHACRVSYKRRTWAKRQEFGFTMDDAKVAGLTANGTWQRFPKAMLRARCISAVARMAFPDSIGGMYTPEELGAIVAVDEHDQVVMEDVRPPSREALVGAATDEIHKRHVRQQWDERNGPHDGRHDIDKCAECAKYDEEGDPVLTEAVRVVEKNAPSDATVVEDIDAEPPKNETESAAAVIGGYLEQLDACTPDEKGRATLAELVRGLNQKKALFSADEWDEIGKAVRSVRERIVPEPVPA